MAGEKAASTGAERRIGKSGSNNGKSARPKRPAQPPNRCPECGSERIWRDGLCYTRYGDVQRWLREVVVLDLANRL